MSTDPEAQLELLAGLIAGAPLNLVSRRDRADVRTLHVDEAVAVGRALDVRIGDRWLDLGTGGGLPGLALAICFPRAQWTLLDATAKKIAAVERFATVLELANVVTDCGRAEERARAGDLREAFDGVVTRALAALPVAAELARGFLRPGGLFAAVKGPRHREELAAVRPALPSLRFAAPETRRIGGTARPTWLVTMRAEGSAPHGVPRATGLPRSQPLGGASS